ncbi:TorF family putative porin [Sphingomonas sp. MS122]|uniref:TorF family putative porin n=1 Tax=Sphingomonas sp. MS122 TaxID=3412683 RepID=UPI003C2BC4C3
MRLTKSIAGALLLAVTATPAFAQEEPAAEAETEASPPLTVTGGVTLITDYRFRGVTQTNEDPAIQGTINFNHESGFYAGVWASTIDGGLDGSTPALTGYGDAEVDLYAGFTKTLSGGLGFDVGLLYYLYPDGAEGLKTDFFEPYAAITYTIGPVSTKLGAAYAWGGQDGLAGFDVKGGNDDNIYVYGDASVAIPTTPITVKGHLGYSAGSLGSLNVPGVLDNNYFDWSVGAEWVGGPIKGGVTYVDTDISNENVVGIGNFAQRRGRGSTVLAYIGFSF